ncbi:hypothetical protein [Desulfosporosinus nitroreducens]|uniref:Uncharacterized protein n=1 Tax=Desulfosporosinus nitroreducens TaxID=2018668 RepID=A0ABT8QU17_9FIRM|nr:hypothetical protein [Desulfosporosinus nitroreducens]MDO0824085.1 hypothetical protein [Desulfosporosinus nitroreducens]
MAISIAMLIQGFLTPVSATPVTKTMTIEFEETLQQSRSKTVTIPNLKSIELVNTNTGIVSHLMSGENVTINISGGSVTGTQPNPTKYSKTGTYTSASSYNSFLSTYPYSDGQYLGSIPKVNSYSQTYVSSGLPADSKTVTASGTFTVNTYNVWNGSSFDYDTTSSGSTYSYNSGGYSGILSLTGMSDGHDTYTGSTPTNPIVGGRYLTQITQYTATYSGNVSKPDTRVYSTMYYADYSGIVYAPGVDNLYSYTVTLSYIDNSDPTITTTLPSENSYFSKLNSAQ